MKKLLLHLLLCLTIGLLASCGGGSGDDDGGGGTSAGLEQFSGSCSLRITNGETCSAGPGPIALVIIEDSAGTPIGLCTGAFLTPSAVLTAAHCFDQPGTSRVQVQVKDAVETAAVLNIPREYRANVSDLSAYDFAVISLQRPIAGVQTLPILVSEPVSVGETINIIGFGIDQNGESVFQGKDFQDGLRKGTMIINELDPSATLFSANYEPTDQSVCSGDSGGPAIALNKDGRPGIVGLTQAVGEIAFDADGLRCLDGSTAYFTSAQSTQFLNKIQRILPGVELL